MQPLNVFIFCDHFSKDIMKKTYLQLLVSAISEH